MKGGCPFFDAGYLSGLFFGHWDDSIYCVEINIWDLAEYLVWYIMRIC